MKHRVAPSLSEQMNVHHVDPIVVYIDTQALRSIAYDLNHPSLTILKGLKSQKYIEIWTSDIALCEMESQLLDEIRTAERDLASINKDLASIYRRSGLALYEEEFALSADSQKLAEEWLDGIKRLFGNGDYVLAAMEIPAKTIFDAYFAKRPPFIKSGNRQKEFPDGFAIASLRSTFPRERVIVALTQDGAFKDGCLEAGIYASTLSEFVNALRSSPIFGFIPLSLDDVDDSIIARVMGLMNSQLLRGSTYVGNPIFRAFESQNVELVKIHSLNSLYDIQKVQFINPLACQVITLKASFTCTFGAVIDIDPDWDEPPYYDDDGNPVECDLVHVQGDVSARFLISIDDDVLTSSFMGKPDPLRISKMRRISFPDDPYLFEDELHPVVKKCLFPSS